MKRIFLAVALCTAALGLTWADDMKCPMGTKDCDTYKSKIVDGQLEQMTKDLSLNKKQQVTVKEALEAQWAAKCAHMQETSEKMGAVNAETEAKIRAVLTSKQAAKYDPTARGKSCCPMAGQKSHQCPTKGEKSKSCCPMGGGEGMPKKK